MLAYAAQGLAGDSGSKSGGQLRDYLRRTDEGLTGIVELVTDLVEAEVSGPATPYHSFVVILERDVGSAQAALQLVLAQPVISSQLIDNLNASIHVRTLLTDFFLLDEILKLQVAQENRPQEP